MLAAISIVIPSVFDNFVSSEMVERANSLNIGVAIVLLVTYGFSLVFMLGTHPDYFAAPGAAPRKAGSAVVRKGRWQATASLALSCFLLAVMSAILVGTVEETASALGVSRAFIGIVILALIGGAPESVAAVAMARRNQLDLTMGIAVGSSIQIALFVAPLLVLSSYWIGPKPLNLIMGNVGIMIVLLPVLLLSLVVSDGRSNWFKGVQLLSVYLLIALFCYFFPHHPVLPLFPASG